jgi:nicotinate-nucleotide pyrophosphorylase (carboxylating)
LELERLARLALSEDLVGADITTEALVPPYCRARGVALAKSELVVCAGALFVKVFELLDPAARCVQHVADGTWVNAGRELWSVEGDARALLQAERAALNLVQRACGIATLTQRFVRALPAGCQTRIADTRKTTPGLRTLERYSVRVGGGHNHRNDLSSAVLIKDNHIQLAGSVTQAVQLARRHAPHTSRIEVEVTTLAMLEEALACQVEIIMLDNFELTAIAEAVRHTQGRALLEVSGGVTLARVPELAQTGVDVLSVGALTHSAPAADISLELTLQG